MRDLNEDSLTEAVLARIAGTADPRLKEIGEALVRHLHGFVRELRPSMAEWQAAIAFLTATGQKCDENRQEFILLSDVLGVSMLVDAINNPVGDAVTETTVFGPFYVPAPEFACGASIAGALGGTPMLVSGTVRAPDGAAIADAIVDIWHADEQGFYDVQQRETLGGPGGRGRFRTDPGGSFHFWTVRPSAYPIPTDGPVGALLRAQARHPYRPEHIHFMIEAPGFRRLVTHVFAEGDAYLESDAVFGVKNSLIRPYVPHQGGTAPDGRRMAGPWFSLDYDFVLAPLPAGRPLTKA